MLIFHTTSSGLPIEDLITGEGKTAQLGGQVIALYTLWLDADGKPGVNIDSFLDRGELFSLPLGAGHVIKGWDEGLLGMCVR